MVNQAKETCYEYFECKEYDCIRRNHPEQNCWEIDDVRCKTHSEEFENLKQLFNSKLEACKLCIYYQECN